MTSSARRAQGRDSGRGNTGTCRRHQRQVAVAIKRAREIVLLPYVAASQEPSSRSHSCGSEHTG
ncbi:MAG: 30S ribosomal protein S18 [Gaiellales bacterium]